MIYCLSDLVIEVKRAIPVSLQQKIREDLLPSLIRPPSSLDTTALVIFQEYSIFLANKKF